MNTGEHQNGVNVATWNFGDYNDDKNYLIFR